MPTKHLFWILKVLLFHRGGISINSYSIIKIYHACRNLQANVDSGQWEPYTVLVGYMSSQHLSWINTLYTRGGLCTNRGGISTNMNADVEIYNVRKNLQVNVDMASAFYELGQCKARPFNFHQVCLFLSFFLSSFSTPTHYAFSLYPWT